MTHQFKVGDKVKLGNINFLEELYSCCERDVLEIKHLELEVIDIDSDGDLVLDTDEFIDYNFSVHPTDAIPIPTSNKNPRKHSELIKQWAEDDSLEIQASMEGGDWYDVVGVPRWDSETNYRIKPKTVTKWKWAFGDDNSCVVYTPPGYFTEDEIKEYTNFGKNFTKLEWTAKEFEI